MITAADGLSGSGGPGGSSGCWVEGGSTTPRLAAPLLWALTYAVESLLCALC